MNDDELDKELRERERLFREPRPVPEGETNLEAYFRDLVSAYVNFPDYLKLELKKAHRYWSLMIEPDVSDYAIVAGKLGRNFNALRTLVLGISMAQGMQIELSLEGPPKDDNRYIRKQLPYRVNPQWKPDAIKTIVGRTLRLAGMKHIRLMLLKNTTINENNPFDDQTYYWFTGMKNEKETVFVFALGQLMESMGVAQGQRLTPKPRNDLVEKIA